MSPILPPGPGDPASVTKTYQAVNRKTGKTGDGQPAVPAAADSVELSPGAQAALDISKAAEAAARALPDTRENLVASLKKQIQNGQYQPDHTKTAENMLSELITGE
jgi:flagellar biosynthesis anti-sigma factor FlgM